MDCKASNANKKLIQGKSDTGLFKFVHSNASSNMKTEIEKLFKKGYQR